MLLELISEFSKVIGYMVKVQKLIFVYTSKINWKMKLKCMSYCASPLLGTCRWLFTSLRIKFKVLSMCYKALLAVSPTPHPAPSMALISLDLPLIPLLRVCSPPPPGPADSSPPHPHGSPPHFLQVSAQLSASRRRPSYHLI